MEKLIVILCLIGLCRISETKAQPFKDPKFIGIFDESWKKSIYNALKADPMGYNLPLIIIETNNLTIVNEPKIAAKIKVIDNSPGKYNFPSDPGNVYDGLAGIELRGQSSQMFPKKSYGFETRDNLGANRNVSLLGMPAENDWVLYALVVQADARP